ncbi:MAG: hypothetical protein AAGJ82_05935 [Bacteroidota bacterium]
MKVQLLRLFTFITVLTVLSCNRDRFLTAAYYDRAPAHQTLAILPSQTITTGRIPAEWTPDMLASIEESESRAFQIAVFDEVTQAAGVWDGDISVNIQHFSETNQLLADAGIDIRDSWDRAPSELAAILGVDAVVRTTVQKDVYLTELESLGISIANTVVSLLGGDLPFFNNRTSDVFLSAAILDGRDGVVLWNTDRVVQTDWNNRHSEIVRRLARMMARRFPYRIDR